MYVRLSICSTGEKTAESIYTKIATNISTSAIQMHSRLHHTIVRVVSEAVGRKLSEGERGWVVMFFFLILVSLTIIETTYDTIPSLRSEWESLCEYLLPFILTIYYTRLLVFDAGVSVTSWQKCARRGELNAREASSYWLLTPPSSLISIRAALSAAETRTTPTTPHVSPPAPRAQPTFIKNSSAKRNFAQVVNFIIL